MINRLRFLTSCLHKPGKRIFFLILILLFTQTAFSQDLLLEAVYYDKNDTPYKIERKYIENNIITYVSHTNKSSVCIKKEISHKADTSIIKVSSYHIFNIKTKKEEFQECDIWSVTVSTTGDTVWLAGSKKYYYSDSMIYVGDTMLTGEAAKSSLSFSDRLETERVPSILNGEMIVNEDSLILKETIISYFLKDIPVKVEGFDDDNNLLLTRTAVVHHNKIIFHSLFVEDGLNPYQVDTIYWNNDTTNIRWSSTRFEWNSTTDMEYQIYGTNLQLVYNDSTKVIWELLDHKTIFKNVLVNNLVYFDQLYFIELINFDREIILHATENGTTTSNTYKFDKQNRIVEQLSFVGGQLQKRVTYKFAN